MHFLARDLDAFAREYRTQHPRPPDAQGAPRSALQAVIAFLDRDALIAAHSPMRKANGFRKLRKA